MGKALQEGEEKAKARTNVKKKLDYGVHNMMSKEFEGGEDIDDE